MSTSDKLIYSELITFIEASQQQLYRVAYTYIADKETALDVVQDTVYKALKGYSRISRPEDIKPWVYRILVNTCIDELRKRGRTVAMAPEEMPEPERDASASAAEEEQQVDKLEIRRFLQTLDKDTRMLIILKYFEDMKLREIAELLDEKENSIKSRLYRGVKQLKRKMDEEDWADA